MADKKLIAVSQIKYNGNVIKPGRGFDCDSKEANRLVKMGAAKEK